MKAGTLVRLVRNKPLYYTTTVASDNEGRVDLLRSRVFIIRPEMVGMCIVSPRKGSSGHFLFGDVIVWIGLAALSALEETG
jgi:hypothetical protein